MALPFISRLRLVDRLCSVMNVISSSAKYAYEKLLLMLIQRENEMNLIKRLLAFFCDEPVEGEEAPAPDPESKPDLTKSLSDEEFGNLSESEQAQYFENSLDKKLEAGDKPAEIPAEDSDDAEDEDDKDDETDDEDDELEVEDNVEEPADDEDDDEDDEPAENETPDVTKKRLTDTQKAFRAARSENAELKKRLDEIEKKVTPAPAAKKPEEEELTLATIKPETLAKAMKEHPVETMRWITDQQVKQTLAQNQKVQTEAQEATDKTNRMKASEDATLKQFPVLGEILKMKPEQLETLKTESKVKYLFGKKTAKYFKVFQARGDEEAFYNAAARAYVELSPEMTKEIQRESKRLAEKELVNKKRVLGKVAASSNKGAIGGKGTPKHKSLSDEEFDQLTPSQQMEYWDKSVDSKLAKRSR